MYRLRFLHIPKTAGTSLVECLKRIYDGPRRCFRFTGDLQADLERYVRRPDRQRIRLVVGHAPYRTGMAEIDRLPAITLLRHPVERVKSYCQHVAEGKSPELCERFGPERFCLDEFLDSGEPQLDNLQVRMLTGEYFGPIDRSNQTALVRRAVEVLEDELAGFGLTEQFEQSVLLWKLTFGWPWPTYRRLNRRGRVPLWFSAGQIDRIVRLNQADLELYQAAARIFHRRIDEHQRRLDQALRSFRRRQRLFQTYGWVYQFSEKVQRRLLRHAA